ncbi:unnamed protein product, partial [Ectocarpus sp. 12 AP-2014]
GAADTVYAGETYRIRIRFPANYPIEAPEVVFVPTAPLHPHIYTNGHICLSILYDEWSPALTIQSVCLSILSMLSSCTAKVRYFCLFICISLFLSSRFYEPRSEKPSDNDAYVRKIGRGSPKTTIWAFHDDTV